MALSGAASSGTAAPISVPIVEHCARIFTLTPPCADGVLRITRLRNAPLADFPREKDAGSLPHTDGGGDVPGHKLRTTHPARRALPHAR